MKVGIVSTWFERGAAYVSKQFYNSLQEQGVDVAIYARGGEHYAKGDPNWDWDCVYWQKTKSFVTSYVERKEFEQWLIREKIDLVIFNEQHYFQAIVWAKKLNVKTVAYIDYYTQNTVKLFPIYDAVICNTQRHLSVFKEHNNPIYIPWGTDTATFKPNGDNSDPVVFFHSCGMSPHRKGTDFLIKALDKIKHQSFKTVIHSQVDLVAALPQLEGVITNLIELGRLEVINKTVSSPGLYYLGDIYVYPSRLEGIGLTIAEALASGLPCIVPDNAPMNEFVSQHCATNKVDNFIARADGYYWPECLSNVEDLANCLEQYIGLSRSRLNQIKQDVRSYALAKLDWQTNSKILKSALEQVKTAPMSSKLEQQLTVFDNKGRPYFTKFSFAYNTLYSVVKRK